MQNAHLCGGIALDRICHKLEVPNVEEVGVTKTPVLTLVNAAITGLPGTTRLRDPVHVISVLEEMLFTRQPKNFIPGHLVDSSRVGSVSVALGKTVQRKITTRPKCIRPVVNGMTDWWVKLPTLSRGLPFACSPTAPHPAGVSPLEGFFLIGNPLPGGSITVGIW